MKINEVIVKEGNYENSEVSRKLSGIGRVLMDRAVTTKDDALSNIMSKVGDALTRYNTPFGPRSVGDLLKDTGISKEMLQKLMKYGEQELKKSGDVAKGADVSDEPEDDDDDRDDDDATMAAKADAAARGK
jgi:hypothetical protein